MTAETNRGGKRRAGLLTVVTVAAVVVALVPAAGAAASGPAPVPRADAAAGSTAAEPGPFVSLLFSRTEISAADNCVEDDDSIARFGYHGRALPAVAGHGRDRDAGHRPDQRHHPSLHALQRRPDRLVGRRHRTSPKLWVEFCLAHRHLPQPAKDPEPDPRQAQAETCGSLATLKAHGLPGAA